MTTIRSLEFTVIKRLSEPALKALPEVLHLYRAVLLSEAFVQEGYILEILEICPWCKTMTFSIATFKNKILIMTKSFNY